MAIPYPNADKPNGLSGASDVWDSEVAGVILSADYFEEAISTAGYIKVFLAGEWVLKPVKYWSGTEWVTKPLKRWSGSAWV